MSVKKIVIFTSLVGLLPSVGAAQWCDATFWGDNAPLVTVTSEAAVNVVLDKCVVTLGIEAKEKDIEAAQSAIAGRARSLIESLKKFGVSEKDIQTDMLMIDPYWDYSSGTGVPKTISAWQSFTVTLTEIKRAQDLLVESAKSGANTVLGVDFQTSELRRIRDQARQMAVRAAREKAQLMAIELGLTGLTPHSLRELQTSSESWYGWWWRARGGGMSQNVATNAPAQGEVQGSSIPPGEIAVRAAVSFSFKHAADNNRLETTH